MNSKTFSKLFVKSFLFGLALLYVVGISSTDVKAQPKITIKKDFCQSVGAQNTCLHSIQTEMALLELSTSQLPK